MRKAEPAQRPARYTPAEKLLVVEGPAFAFASKVNRVGFLVLFIECLLFLFVSECDDWEDDQDKDTSNKLE